MSEFVYLYNSLPDDFSENGLALTDWISAPEINRQLNGTYQFYGVYQRGGNNYDQIEEEKYVSAIVPDGTQQFFEILEKKKTPFGVTIAALHMGYGANRNFIDYSFTSSGTGKTIMDNLHKSIAFKQLFIYKSDVVTTHQFTAKEVKPVEAIMGSNNGNQNLVGVTSAELDMDNNILNLKRRIGSDNGYRVDFGINMESIEEVFDKKPVINSLYLIGGVPDGTDYDADQSPVTYKYLNVKGLEEKDRRIGSRTNDSCKTEEDLKLWGTSLYEKNRIHEARVTHIVSMVELDNTIEYQEDLIEETKESELLYNSIAKLQLGDTVYCSSPEIGINIQERMIEYTWFPTILKYKEVVLGNEIPKYTSAVETSIQQANAKLEEKTNVLQNAIINATNWITGTTEGHVVFRPKNAPIEILIMDTPDVKTAKKVWRWNMGGLGYSDQGVDGGPNGDGYKLAMTQDGAIVADFITTGTLRAIDIFGVNIEGSNIKGTNIEGSTIRSADPNFEIKIANGVISFINKLTNKEMGAIFPAYSDGEVKGFTFLQKYGYDLAIGTQSADGKYHSNVLEVPRDSTPDNPKLNLYGEVRFKGKIFLNDQEITPGGTGGGGWNGDYPSEITTQAEKFAWQAWATLISMGYSKEAAAGILGNIQGEAGPSMNPDTEQVGGPAYGAIQFDGSTYPLIGAPTNNGREYFQRLHTASGVGGNYKEMAPQMKVVNWAMTNGQWIGVVDPTTVGGFKGINSPEQAAYAFEKNFERPASAHPERQGWAREWYNKFKGLVQPGGKYGYPVLAGTPITSWFGERWGTMHNGIDFGGVIGDPIFAAQSGTVVYSYYDNDMGEWVVIKHDNDDYMTGYAHNSARLVNVGDRVTKGQQIARMGNTGDSTGPHLHFAVQTAQWSGYVDPAPFLGLTPP